MDREDVVVEVVRDERRAAGEELDLRHVLGAARAVVHRDVRRPFDDSAKVVAEGYAALLSQVVPPDRRVVRQIDLRRERERRRQIAVLKQTKTHRDGCVEDSPLGLE